MILHEPTDDPSLGPSITQPCLWVPTAHFMGIERLPETNPTNTLLQPRHTAAILIGIGHQAITKSIATLHTTHDHSRLATIGIVEFKKYLDGTLERLA